MNQKKKTKIITLNCVSVQQKIGSIYRKKKD